ncbi:hypothetical protein NDA10_004521 [Ustilago hordei]|nr:hypothetical protein NDA10_004521 [Ustilago hordei]
MWKHHPQRWTPPISLQYKSRSCERLGQDVRKILATLDWSYWARETRQAGPEEEEQCRRSRHQVMRRRSSVEGVDTTQEAQGCQAGEAPEQYSMKKVLSGERAGAASLAML